MKNVIKTTIAAVAATGMLLGATIVPSTASAQPSYVCKTERSNDARTGMILGALAGGAVGGSVANTHNKGLGTVAGAVIGGFFGNKIGSNHGKSTCNKIEAAAQEEYGHYDYRTGRTTHRYHDSRYGHPYAYGYGNSYGRHY